MRELTKLEKEMTCARFAEHMPKLRKMIKLTQSKLGEICGYSRIRISNIETKREALSWHQIMAFALVFLSNERSKEYIVENKILDESFFEYIVR